MLGVHSFKLQAFSLFPSFPDRGSSGCLSFSSFHKAFFSLSFNFFFFFFTRKPFFLAGESLGGCLRGCSPAPERSSVAALLAPILLRSTTVVAYFYSSLLLLSPHLDLHPYDGKGFARADWCPFSPKAGAEVVTPRKNRRV